MIETEVVVRHTVRIRVINAEEPADETLIDNRSELSEVI